MRIDLLTDFPEYIEVLAPPILEHWRFALPEDDLKARVGKLKAHCRSDGFPIAWVAHDGGEVFGTAALRQCDLEGREDLTPWLGGVFTLPPFRRRGIAERLCKAVEGHARGVGVEALYLFTLDRQNLYRRLGWREFDTALWRSRRSDIMVKHLAPADK